MSGYDIKKIVDVGLSHFWNENYGQIYPTLEELVSSGLALKSTETKTGRRKRNAYTITPAGVAVFRDWLDQPTEPLHQRNEILLKFFLSGKLPSEISLKIVEEYKQQQLRVLKDYQDSEAALRQAIETGDYPDEVMEIFAGQSGPLTAPQKAHQCRIFLLSLRHGLLALEGRLAWCDEVVDLLSVQERT